MDYLDVEYCVSFAFSDGKKFVAGNFVSSWLGHGVRVINWLFCFLLFSVHIKQFLIYFSLPGFP